MTSTFNELGDNDEIQKRVALLSSLGHDVRVPVDERRPSCRRSNAR